VALRLKESGARRVRPLLGGLEAWTFQDLPFEIREPQTTMQGPV